MLNSGGGSQAGDPRGRQSTAGSPNVMADSRSSRRTARSRSLRSVCLRNSSSRAPPRDRAAQSSDPRWVLGIALHHVGAVATSGSADERAGLEQACLVDGARVASSNSIMVRVRIRAAWQATLVPLMLVLGSCSDGQAGSARSDSASPSGRARRVNRRMICGGRTVLSRRLARRPARWRSGKIRASLVSAESLAGLSSRCRRPPTT